MLKENGYHTAMAGKWHLGHKSPFLPTDHGFETYFGIPCSNDLDRNPETKDISHITITEEENFKAFNVPLMRKDQIIERPVDQRT